MTTMTGPARLRQIAEFTILSAAELRQLAAQWEADLERAALDQAERDAARAEVARLTAAIDKLIQAPKNGSGYEGFEKAYDELKALRQPAPENKTGPALNRPGADGVTVKGQGDYTACPKCGHPMGNHDDVIGCFEYECECDVTAPAQGQE